MYTTYTKRLTNKQVISLFRRGIYRVREDGEIIGKRGKVLKGITSGTRDNGREYIRLFYKHKYKRNLPKAHAVWMGTTLRSIPKGFEIHHRNEDVTDDRWENLFCLFKMDHDKLHGKGLSVDNTPF